MRFQYQRKLSQANGAGEKSVHQKTSSSRSPAVCVSKADFKLSMSFGVDSIFFSTGTDTPHAP